MLSDRTHLFSLTKPTLITLLKTNQTHLISYDQAYLTNPNQTSSLLSDPTKKKVQTLGKLESITLSMYTVIFD